MLSANSTSSHVHYDATKTQCAICITEIGNQSSKDSRQMYKLCTKYLHSGIAKEIPDADACAFEGTSSDKDQIQLCGKCLGSAKKLAEVTGTLASLRKRVSDMVIIFTLEILHRRGKNARNEEAGIKLIKVDVSKFPDNDSWSSPTFTATDETDEMASAEMQENIDDVGCMDKKENNVDPVDYDLDIKAEDIVEIELMTEVQQLPGSIGGRLRNTHCATTESISPQENLACVTEIGNTLEVSEYDAIEGVVRTLTGGKDQNASTETNASEIAIEDVVIEENIDLTKCKDKKTVAESNVKSLQNRISMPVRLQRLSPQWKSNPNGQDIILVNDGRKSNTIPKFELILKREPEVSTVNIPDAFLTHKVQNISVPTTSTSAFSLPVLSTKSNSKAGCDPVDKHRIPMKKNVELTLDLNQKDSNQNQKSKSKHSGDSNRRNSKKGGFPCTMCKKTFLKMSHLLIHKRQHLKTRSRKCSLCPQRFSAQTQLKNHQLMKHGDKIVKCLFCDKEFAQSWNLNEHMRTHTGEKPFKCDVCAQSFAQSSTLTNHKRIHTGEKPFNCTSCKMSFARNSYLTKHIRIHTGEKPIKCSFCDKEFSCKASVERHLRTHTGEKPFKCDKCDYSGAQNSTLIEHKIYRHSNKRSLKCRDCQKTFKMRGDVRHHYKQVHANIEFTDECILPNN